MDHDFLTEAIARFPEDDTVQAGLVGAVEDLSYQLARMNMNHDYKPYIMVSTCKSYLSGHEDVDISKGITKYSPIPCNDKRYCSVPTIPSSLYTS